MDYSKYTSKDFILDDDFKSWILGPTPQKEAFWQKFLEDNPGKVAEVSEASALISAMRFKDYKPLRQECEVDWSRLNNRIESFENVGERSGWFYLSRIAASLLFFIVLGFLIYTITRPSSDVRITSDYGQIKTVILPDQSVVTLNANSTLVYPAEWKEEETREVHLEGEAFFEIKRKQKGEKFLVHTKGLVVEVIGTKFNVNDRRRVTQVVLSEGQVKVNLTKGQNDPGVLMEIGDLVEYSEANQNLKRRRVNPYVYCAWKNKEWILDNLSLKDLAIKIEETYGVKVVIANSGLVNETVTGAVPTENLPMLLDALAITCKLDITQNKDLITIKP